MTTSGVPRSHVTTPRGWKPIPNNLLIDVDISSMFHKLPRPQLTFQVFFKNENH